MRALTGVVVVLAGLAAPAFGSVRQEVAREIAPRVIKEVKPQYPAAVRAEGVEGIVRLECLVREDGTVGEARVIAPLHPELDREALRSVTEWRFQPGTKDGKPVAVRVEIEMSFSLRDALEPSKGPLLDSPEVFKPSPAIKTPTLLSEVKPQYTANAMRAKVGGRVKLECVVLTDGTVGDVRVAEQLHPELDNEAVRALRKWRFRPGMKDGVAVPVQVQVEMTFTLRSDPPKSPGER